MKKLKATLYGQVELFPGIKSDSYVLSDSTTVLSERGTADLLGVDKKFLNNIRENWPPEVIKPYVLERAFVIYEPIKVTAKNSPHKGKKIVVYDVIFIQSFITGYALAFSSGELKPDQIHIGERCLALQSSLVRSTLDAVIKE
ncbi:MAG: hypothetical protein IMF12_09790 [Proteobacteria bacterium]|nr:hypothetical protein [Pseudomonadota bacterium]